MTDLKSKKPIDLLIVGAGFAGLCMLQKARQIGLTALVVEAEAGVGGTWYRNRYPGARVDIQSLEYSFGFSEELQQEWTWSERYAAQPELLKYANHVADRFKLRDEIRLNTRVSSMLFNDALSLWNVDLDGVENSILARFVVMAGGSLSSPNVPEINGLERFGGSVYHTANWPTNAVDFSAKQVAVIGTGSSGIQVIPEIAKQAEELTVFQRTASYCIPAQNGPIDTAYERKVKADYAGFRRRNLLMQGGFGADLPKGGRSALSVTADEREAVFESRWEHGGITFLNAYDDLLISLEANELAAEFVRRKIRQTVRDPEVARKLTPTHAIGCKRLCAESGYYETFNRTNVDLIDVNAFPIDEVSATGIGFGGLHRKFDAIVFATGFDAMTGTMLRLNLRGRGGLSIQDHWRDGPLNYLGLMISGFPNFFNIAGPGSASAFTNVIMSIEHHVNWISQCIRYIDSNGYSAIEATPEAERKWVGHVNSVAARTLMVSCKSWYQGSNIQGKPQQFMPLLGFPAYVRRCEEVASDGYPGFLLS